jgi:Na+/proline symporter
MITIAEIHSDRFGNSHSIRCVLCIIMSFLMPIYIEMFLPCVSLLNEKMITEIGVMT